MSISELESTINRMVDIIKNNYDDEGYNERLNELRNDALEHLDYLNSEAVETENESLYRQVKQCEQRLNNLTDDFESDEDIIEREMNGMFPNREEDDEEF